MGIDISAKLMYGLRYSDVPEDIIEQVDEDLDNGELDYASPYYDAPRSKWIIGADNYCYGHSYSALLEQLEDAEDDFPKYIRDHEDVVLGIFATPHVY